MLFQYDHITFYLKMFVLLYADDTVVFQTGEKDFQINHVCSFNTQNIL